MDISKILVHSELNNDSPLYLQIAEIIIDKIMDSSLREGDKLPSERELASLFNVSRTTAINSYRYIEQQGYVITKPGSGTFVSKKTDDTRSLNSEIPWENFFKPSKQTSMNSLFSELINSSISSDKISLDAGMPDPKFYPVDKFKDIFYKYMDALDTKDFGHISIEGLSSLRNTIPSIVSNKEIRTSYDNVLITSGSQQGIYLISKTLIEPGDYVIVESPTYIGAIQVLQAAGARILSLPIDNGLPLNILEDYLIRYRPKLFYTIPTFQNPSGNVMSISERRDLLELAKRYRLIIVEDDPYSDFHYKEKPPTSLKSLDNYEGTIYLSTFSKIIMPGLRLGYVIAHPTLISRMTMEKQYIDLHSNNFAQWFLNIYLSNGELGNHLALVRKEYKKRRDVLYKSLKDLMGEDLAFSFPQGGFYIWCNILSSFNSRRLLHEALNRGVSFVPGDVFYNTPDGNKKFRLCFTSNDEKSLQKAAYRLYEALLQTKKSSSRILKNDSKPLI